MICSFLNKNLASSRGVPQENDAKFRFAIHPQGIEQFHDNYQIADDIGTRLVTCRKIIGLKLRVPI